MSKRCLLSICALLLFSATISQVQISMDIQQLSTNEIYFGKMFGKRSEQTTPIARNEFGNFVLSLDETPAPGIYAISYRLEPNRTPKAFQIILLPGPNYYSLTCIASVPHETMKVQGQEELNIYNLYYNDWERTTSPHYSFVDEWRMRQDELSFENLAEMEQDINVLQQRYLEDYPYTVTSEIIRQTRLSVPHGEGTIVERAKARQDYFDQSIQISNVANNELFWSSPIGITWLDIHSIRSPDVDLDQAYSRICRLLEGLAPNKKAWSYYLSYLLNSYYTKNKNNFEQIYIQLVNDFVKTGKADLLDNEALARHLSQAENLARLSPGRLAPDITLYKQDESSLDLNQLKAEYTMIMFWNPDCSHCQRELPMVKKVLSRHPQLDLQLVTVCGKKRAKVISCYDYLQKHFPENNWINLSDPNNSASVNSVYYITSTPTTILLDRDKKILWRRSSGMSEYELDKNLKDLHSLPR